MLAILSFLNYDFYISPKGFFKKVFRPQIRVEQPQKPIKRHLTRHKRTGSLAPSVDLEMTSRNILPEG
jgi:hypothetical protein